MHSYFPYNLLQLSSLHNQKTYLTNDLLAYLLANRQTSLTLLLIVEIHNTYNKHPRVKQIHFLSGKFVERSMNQTNSNMFLNFL